MNNLFKEMIKEDEDFVYTLEDKAMEYMKENNLFKEPIKTLISVDLNSRSSLEKIKSSRVVKEVLIPNKTIYVKRQKSEVSNFGLETYLRGQQLRPEGRSL